MNFFWYKLKLSIFITFLSFILISITWDSFFLIKYYKNNFSLQKELDKSINNIEKIDNIKLIFLLNKLSDIQVLWALWNIISTNSNIDNSIKKLFWVKKIAIFYPNKEPLFFNFNVNQCNINYICKSFIKNNYTFIYAKKFEPFSYTTHSIFVFTIFVFFISILLFFPIYFGVKIITKPIEKNYEFMKNFVNNAWHELKTPIANINLSAQILKKEEKIDKEVLNDIINQSSKISKLIDTLLNISILNKQTKKENIDIENIVKDSLDKFDQKIKEKNISVNLDIKNNNIYTNKEQLEILINNLISNAIKYNIKNWELKIIVDKKYIEISNSWNPILNKSNIFNMFYREDNKEEWYWLWLAIVKKIIDINWWKIKIISENWINKFIIKY